MDKRVNVVGIGRHAKKNIYPCLQHLGVHIESVTTHSKEKALVELERLGIQACVYDNVDEMLKKSQSDMVILVVPMEEVYSLVMKCLQAGKRVFVEKPCGLSIQQARDIYECSSEMNIPVFIGFMKRYAPCYKKMKEYIKQGDLGYVRSFEAHFNVDASAFCETDRDFMYAVAIHYLDLLRTLFGDIKQVTAIKNEFGNGVSYALMMTMDDGIVGTLSLENRGPWTRESEGITCTLDGGFIQSIELNELVVHTNNFIEDNWQTLSEEDRIYRETYTPASGTLKDLYLRGFMQEFIEFFKVDNTINDDNVKITNVIEDIIKQLK